MPMPHNIPTSQVISGKGPYQFSGFVLEGVLEPPPRPPPQTKTRCLQKGTYDCQRLCGSGSFTSAGSSECKQARRPRLVSWHLPVITTCFVKAILSVWCVVLAS